MMHGLLIRRVALVSHRFDCISYFGVDLSVFILTGSTRAQRHSRYSWLRGQDGKSCFYLSGISCTNPWFFRALILMSDHGNVSDSWSSVLHYNVVPIKQRLEQLKGMCCPSTWPRFLYSCIYSCFISPKTLMSKRIKVMSTAETPRGREVNNS